MPTISMFYGILIRMFSRTDEFGDTGGLNAER